MSILILGGTADARRLTEKLHQQGLMLVYSVAGLVRTPNVSCEIISGGFTQFGGLVEYLRLRKADRKPISAILDVTHPYANKMSGNAVLAAKEMAIPCWRFQRPAWEMQEGDHWQLFENWELLLPALAGYQSIFFTAGQLYQATIRSLGQSFSEQSFSEHPISEQAPQKYLLRTAVAPTVSLPSTMQWIKAIGPFDYQNELDLMRQHHVDLLVSKNSGGDSTVAKLEVARDLAIPVFMLARPTLAKADRTYNDIQEYENDIVNQLKN